MERSTRRGEVKAPRPGHYVLALRATHARTLLQRVLLAQGQLQHTPLFAGGKAHPRERPETPACNQPSKGGISAVFAIANSNGRAPKNDLGEPLKPPSSFPGDHASRVGISTSRPRRRRECRQIEPGGLGPSREQHGLRASSDHDKSKVTHAPGRHPYAPIVE